MGVRAVYCVVCVCVCLLKRIRKSVAAEALLDTYISTHLVHDLHVFSILMPLHDVLIFSLLRGEQNVRYWFGWVCAC